MTTARQDTPRDHFLVAVKGLYGRESDSNRSHTMIRGGNKFYCCTVQRKIACSTGSNVTPESRRIVTVNKRKVCSCSRFNPQNKVMVDEIPIRVGN